MRKILSAVLSLILVISLFAAVPFTVNADTEYTSGDFTYTYYNGQATVTGYIGNQSVIIIPDTLGGYPVTEIGYMAMYNKSGVTSVTIPEGVTQISDSAFWNCTNLKTVNIPDSVHFIDVSAFNGSGITSVTLPAKLSYIGYKAFANCKNLISVNIPKAAEFDENVFENCTSLKEVNIESGVTTIGYFCFKGCSALQTISIPSSVTDILGGAFYGCTSFSTITLPSTVKSIGGSAFLGTAYYNNDSNWENDALYIGNHLINVKQTVSGQFTVKSGTKSIAGNAFGSCYNLTSVVLPKGLKIIGGGAFSYCESLSSVTFSTGLELIGMGAFQRCTSLKSIVLPKGLKTIGTIAFYECTALESITIPDSVTMIGEYTFSDTAYVNNESNWKNGILYINNHLIFAASDYSGHCAIKAGTKSIACQAFSSARNLSSVYIPNSVVGIGNYAFFNLGLISSITIPDSVTTIGDYAFANCSLYSLSLGKGVKTIGAYAFDGCNFLNNITIPDTVTFIGENAFRYTKAYYESRKNGALYIGNHLIDVSSDYKGAFTVKSGTKTIAEKAFYKRTKLTSVKIAGSVTNVNRNAFTGCTSLKTITKPYTLKLDAPSGTKVVSVHTNKTVNTKATLSKNGVVNKKVCTVCGKVTSAGTVVYRPTSITLSNTVYTYNGGVKTPTVTVKNANGVKLVKDKDYTVKYNTTRKNAGKHKVTVTMKGNYSGTKYLYFTIKPAASGIKASLSNTQYTYNGAVKSPTVTVKNASGVKLVNGRDYTVKYNTTRKNAGKHKVTVTMKGNYSGTKYLYFTIKPAASGIKASLSNTQYTYNGAVKSPTVTVKNASGVKLVNGKDYTIKYYTNRKSVGKHKIAVVMKGNYSGTKYLYFNIKSAPKLQGWQYSGTGYRYYTNGKCAYGWKLINGSYYYFKSNGYMATGWVNDGGSWYYMNSSGAMVTGWQAIDGCWYFFNGSGAMVTGWLNSGGAWYYMNSSGAMATGWVLDGNTWYWIDADGVWRGYTEPA